MSILLRRDSTGEDGTFGSLIMDGEILCLTCELPWLNNQPNISCIPVGNYEVIPHDSHDHPGTWEITGVPHRTGILFHNGNTDNDSKGCVIVGSSIGQIDGKTAVLNSVKTLDILRDKLPSNFSLTIVNDF